MSLSIGSRTENAPVSICTNALRKRTVPIYSWHRALTVDSGRVMHSIASVGWGRPVYLLFGAVNLYRCPKAFRQSTSPLSLIAWNSTLYNMICTWGPLMHKCITLNSVLPARRHYLTQYWLGIHQTFFWNSNKTTIAIDQEICFANAVHDMSVICRGIDIL